MAHFSSSDIKKEWFGRANANYTGRNRRMSIRYVRTDIAVFIKKTGILNFNLFSNGNTDVKLIDIGSRGILIASKLKLDARKNILLTLRFSDFKEFEIPSKVMWKADGDKTYYVYGIKFDQLNEGLADHLVVTQKKLTIR